MAIILQSRIHIICCMRSKMDYVLEQDVRGKMVPRRVGMAPIMRDGIEYEYSTVFDGGLDHFVSVSKDRTGLFTDQYFQITEETGRKLLAWLNAASEAEPAPSTGSTTDQSPMVLEPESPAAPIPQPANSTETSAQERLQQALYGVHPDWVVEFLVNRKQIAPGQTVLDASADYCTTALSKIKSFRAAIIKFGEERDAIVVGS
jgi:hypothetical protein